MDSQPNDVGPVDAAAENAAQTAGPRTRTQLDDMLTRSIGRLPPMAGFWLSVGIYVILGILLPVLMHTGRSWTIALGVFGASGGAIVLMSALLAVKQAGDRRRLIEWTSDLRKLDATEFEWLVGEVLRREGWAVSETGKPDVGTETSTFERNVPGDGWLFSASAGRPDQLVSTRCGSLPGPRLPKPQLTLSWLPCPTSPHQLRQRRYASGFN